jgi:hypothetical protein
MRVIILFNCAAFFVQFLLVFLPKPTRLIVDEKLIEELYPEEISEAATLSEQVLANWGANS